MAPDKKVKNNPADTSLKESPLFDTTFYPRKILWDIPYKGW
jgi:hypothetical protein